MVERRQTANASQKSSLTRSSFGGNLYATRQPRASSTSGARDCSIAQNPCCSRPCNAPCRSQRNASASLGPSARWHCPLTRLTKSHSHAPLESEAKMPADLLDSGLAEAILRRLPDSTKVVVASMASIASCALAQGSTELPLLGPKPRLEA